MLLQVANRLAPKADYLDTCVDQISWIFGRNYYNRSQVTGLGINPPMHPHHRPSQADGIDSPWPGLLVGGGNNTSTQAAGNKNGATNWIDDVNDYELNEVAINWNAPLTYALAGFLDSSTGPAGGDAAVSQSDTNATGGSGGSAGSGGSGGSGGSASLASSGGSSGTAAGGPGGTASGGAGGSASGGVSGSGGANSGGSAASGGDRGSGGQTSTHPSSGSGSKGCGCALGAPVPFSWSPFGLGLLLVVGAFRRLCLRKTVRGAK
jgi:hypothetical protein